MEMVAAFFGIAAVRSANVSSRDGQRNLAG
jgi:hypothetical protein